MIKKHQKRLTAPKTWPIKRKGIKFITRPNPGKKFEYSISLNTVLKDFIKKTNTTMGLVLKNAGLQIISFSGTREKVPFEIQAGITQGLAYAPFRFSIQLQNLERWDLTYEKETSDDFFFGSSSEQQNKFDLFADKLMRHAIFGVELLLGESFHFDAGFNYKRRQGILKIW